MRSQARVRKEPIVRIVFDGQSLNNTPQDTAGQPFRLSPQNFPYKLIQNVGSYNGVPIEGINIAISGQGWYQLAADVTTRRNVWSRNKAGTYDILILNGGQGDVWNVANTGAQAYTNLTNYINSARSAGFDYIVVTTLPGAGPNVLGTGRPTVNEYTAMADFRTLIMGNAAGADRVVDLYVPPLVDATNGTYFFFDRTHMMEPGAQAMADLVTPAVKSILESL